jgi:hypothetical protein
MKFTEAYEALAAGKTLRADGVNLRQVEPAQYVWEDDEAGHFGIGTLHRICEQFDVTHVRDPLPKLPEGWEWHEIDGILCACGEGRIVSPDARSADYLRSEEASYRRRAAVYRAVATVAERGES